jgi:hypothetical protein
VGTFNPRKDFYLQVIPGISFCGPYILADIPPESKDHVENDGRPHREKRCVNKVLPDLTGSNPHAVPDGGAYAESIPFYKIFHAVHDRTKLEKSPED